MGCGAKHRAVRLKEAGGVRCVTMLPLRNINLPLGRYKTYRF
jgi:hypothetical protein